MARYRRERYYPAHSRRVPSAALIRRLSNLSPAGLPVLGQDIGYPTVTRRRAFGCTGGDRGFSAQRSSDGCNCVVQGCRRETSDEEADSARTLIGEARWYDRYVWHPMQLVVEGAHRRGGVCCKSTAAIWGGHVSTSRGRFPTVWFAGRPGSCP